LVVFITNNIDVYNKALDIQSLTLTILVIWRKMAYPSW